MMSKKCFRGYPVHSVCEPEPEKGDVEWLIWAAWSDRYTFEQIEQETGLCESEVIRVMRLNQSVSTFKRWRRRVRQSSLKHGRQFAMKRRDGRLQKHGGAMVRVASWTRDDVEWMSV